MAVALVTGLKRYRNIDLSFGMASLIQNRISSNWMTPENAELAGCAIFSAGVWLTSLLARQLTLQRLFSYHGWMYEERNNVTLRTKLWMVSNQFQIHFIIMWNFVSIIWGVLKKILVKVLVGYNPRLNSYQSLLPRLPVPKLEDTVQRVILFIHNIINNRLNNWFDYKSFRVLNK